MGVFLGTDHITTVLLTKGPGRPRIKSHESFPFQMETVLETLEEIVQKNPKAEMVLGLSNERCFFFTKEGPKEGKIKPSSIEGGFKSGISFGEKLGTDWLDRKCGTKRFVNVGAAPKDLLEMLLSPWGQSRNQLKRVETESMALLRASHLQLRPSLLKPLTEIRFFVRSHQHVAILCFGKVPFVSHTFHSKSRSPNPKHFHSVFRMLSNQATRTFNLPDVSVVHFFGKESLETFETDFLKLVEVDVKCKETKMEDDAYVAFGSALGCQLPPDESLNLARKFQNPVSWKSIFPKQKALMLGTLVLFLGLVMGNRLLSVEQRLTSLQKQNAETVWAVGLKNSKLEKEKKNLEKHADGMAEFLSSRILWTPYFEEIMRILPKNTRVTNIEAANRVLVKGAKTKLGYQYLLIRGSAYFPNGVTTPREIDITLNAFKSSEMMQRDFPIIRLDNVIWKKEGRDDLAFFTIVCLQEKTRRKKRKRT